MFVILEYQSLPPRQLKGDNMSFYVIDSPIGNIGIEANNDFIVEIELLTSRSSEGHLNPLLRQAETEIQLFFLGKLKHFTLPFQFKGTVFKQAVLHALLTIPYGTTVSYQDVAIMIGHPKAYRAVGTACATNDLPLIIPCHRVIKSDHSIGGFGARPDIKKQIIDLEKANK
jgi:methylated-DNA-[protein]-cysteine S-methyltransferase